MPFSNSSSSGLSPALMEPLQIANKPTGGNIGTAAATVDIADHFIVTQTTAGQALTLPAPTKAASSPVVTIEASATSVPFTIYGQPLLPGSSLVFGWNGSAWKPAFPAPNLTPLDVNSFEPTGTGSTFYVPDRAGARIANLKWNHYDRRVDANFDPLFPLRFTEVILTAVMMSGDGGWALTLENTNRNTVRKVLTLDGQPYTAIVQWLKCPGGTRFWLQESHQNTLNTYGGFELLQVNWEVAS